LPFQHTFSTKLIIK